MSKSKLLKVSYKDTDNGISLTGYADTIVFNPVSMELALIRFGGYPESVRGMSDAIFGGGDIEALLPNETVMLKSLTKQYHRQLVSGEVYAEAVLTVRDDDISVKAKKDEDDSEEDEEEIALPPRIVYIFAAAGDSDRLFEEIDRKTSVPLIPEYKDYLLSELKKNNILSRLVVMSRHTQMDAWALSCSQDDLNIAGILERGLKNGDIAIPNAENADNSVFERVDSVTSYLREFGIAMATKIKERFTPLFDPDAENLSPQILAINDNIQRNLGYSLYNAQLACAEAVKQKIMQHEPAIVVAECGSGKTKIGAVALCAAHAAEGMEKSFNVVICPSHVAPKWVRELEESIPNCFAAVIGDVRELKLLYNAYERDNRTAFAVITKEKARDGYMRAPSAFWHKRKRAFLCPCCHKVIEMDLVSEKIKYRVYADAKFFLKENSDNHKCEHCNEVLWSPIAANTQSEWVRIGEYGYVHRKFAWMELEEKRIKKNASLYEKIASVAENPNGLFVVRGARRAYPLSTYIKHHMRGRIDGFIADELHEFAQNSGQGDAMAEIAAASKKVIGMTATLINGYSSGIFYLLWRLFSRYMVADLQKHEEIGRFNKEYGVTEAVYELKPSGGDYSSNRRTTKVKVRERLLPGVSPLVYARYLMENAVFLSLVDMGKELPEYEEFPMELDMLDSIREEYQRIQTQIKRIMSGDRKIARKIQSAAMNLLTVYPDQPYSHEPILDPRDDTPLIIPGDTGAFENLSAKDLKLLELLERKINAGERVIIYTSWTRIDTQVKLNKLLTEKGYKVAVLKTSVRPQQREEWVANKVSKGTQILITNPSLVETGLDLNDFTTLVYYNIAYKLFTLRQSSRRSWRINQTAPRIEVYFFYYKATIQARAMSLMASKLAAAGLLEGQVTDEGLAAMSDCRDLTSQLAMELTKGISAEVEDISAVFKRMAILKTDDEKAEFAKSKAITFPASDFVSEAKQKNITAVAADKDDFPAYDDARKFVFSAPKRRKRNAAAAAQVEEQISFEDWSA